MRLIRLLFMILLSTIFLLDQFNIPHKFLIWFLLLGSLIELMIYFVGALTYNSLTQFEKISEYYSRASSKDYVFEGMSIVSILLSSYYLYCLYPVFIIVPILFIIFYITYQLVVKFDKSIDDIRELELPMIETMLRTWSVGKLEI